MKVAIGVACLAAAVLVGQEASRPYGLPTRVKWTTSKLQGSPDPPKKFRLVRAFPQVTFDHPVYLAQEPTSERLFVAEYEKGRIYSFLPQDTSGKKDLFLEMGRGISAFSFHPKYSENGQVFVFSHLDHKVKGAQKSRVSRFVLEKGSNPPRVKPGSETIIVEWPASGHNGGEAIIGPDGYLYISTGDGTSGSDRNETGQRLDDLLAVMMRLDVDNPSEGRNYGIPKDNPFVNRPGARPEIWAYGYRNPWRFSFDPKTGQPWVGDVGQDIWEMIELSYAGANHGWSVKEGSHDFHPKAAKGPTPFTPPVVEHHHTEARSITGGYVYTGAKFPELRDWYVYGDYQYGKMWALKYDHAAKNVVAHEEIASTTVKIASFGVGRDGSFYAVEYDTGMIHQLERMPPQTSRTNFPRKLSETGLFTSVAKHQVAPGVIPYSINAPFWSDGAIKERYFAVPGEQKIKFQESRAWEFEDGAVTVKSFQLEMEEGKPESRRRIETRVVLKWDDRWVGYTYQWRDDQTDADLVEAAGADRTYSIKQKDGTRRQQVWHYPSRNECMFCHSRAAGFVLGIKTSQMNRDHAYAAATDNQIRALDHVGMFVKSPAKSVTALPSLVDPYGVKGTLELRARTWLEVNCAMCHVNDGGGNSAIELDLKTKLEKANLIDEVPLHDTFGLRDPRLVAKGDPARSVLYERVKRRGGGQMPPTSSNRVDAAGARLLAEWIRSLK